MRTDHARPSRADHRKNANGGGIRNERGAVLVHVAIAMIGLISFSALVVDYGVLWLARRQAQNAADAGAMAGAISMAFFDFDDQATARTSAINTAQANYIFGEVPDIVETDVTFPVCPPGSPGEGEFACIRVNVFRTNYERDGGNPLPTFFGNLFGVTEQGVRATATAQVVSANSTDCLRPWAIVDRWDEAPQPTPPYPDPDWSMDDEFDIATDLYIPPTEDDPGTGFTLETDYGRQFAVNQPPPGQDSISPGWYRLIDIPRADQPNTGADTVNENILTCGGIPAAYAASDGEECPDDMLGYDDEQLAYWAARGCYRVQTGYIGSQQNSVNDLIAMDPDAYWDEESNSVEGGDFDAGESPRIVPIGIFDIARYMTDDPSGNGGVVRMVNILGFFIEGMGDLAADGSITCCSNGGQAIIGRIVSIPGSMLATGGDVAPPAAFLVDIMLVR